MRALMIAPVLLATLACSSRLEKAKAEALIRREYPVVVPVTVPERASADRGTPEHLRLTALKAQLDATGWFETATQSEGSRETFTFRLNPGAPKAIKAAPKGFAMPAAEAAFVRAVRMEATREGARVTYEIRLEKPTAQFPLFQALHPEVKAGATKTRQATFEKRRGGWELTGTDEVFRKAE